MGRLLRSRASSRLAQGGKNNDGSKRDWTSRPAARMAFFYTGPITDWLGLWTEIGYLGNNAINSVTTGNTGPTGLNFYAYDEYRLSTGMDIGPNSFIGASIGNEHPNVVTQWVFPAGLPDMWGNGQGGTGRAKEIMALSFHGFFADRFWAQVAFVTGDNDVNWSDGSNQYAAFAYNIFRTTRNDLWVALELYRGKDQSTQMTQVRQQLICPALSDRRTIPSCRSPHPGGTLRHHHRRPVCQIEDFTDKRASTSVADRGPHSWIPPPCCMAEGRPPPASSSAPSSADTRVLLQSHLRFTPCGRTESTTRRPGRRVVRTRSSTGDHAAVEPAMTSSTPSATTAHAEPGVDDQRNLYQGDGTRSRWALNTTSELSAVPLKSR